MIIIPWWAVTLSTYRARSQMHFYVVMPLSALVPINSQLYADAHWNISEIHFACKPVKWCYTSALWVNAYLLLCLTFHQGSTLWHSLDGACREKLYYSGNVMREENPDY